MKKLNVFILFLALMAATDECMDRPGPLDKNDIAILKKALNGRYEDNYFTSKTTEQLRQIAALARDALNDKQALNILNSQILKVTAEEKKNPNFIKQAIDDLIYNANATIEYRQKSQKTVPKKIKNKPIQETAEIRELRAKLIVAQKKRDEVFEHARVSLERSRAARDKWNAEVEKRESEALINAAFLGDIHTIKKMIADGVNLDAKGKEGRTALMEAVLFDNKEIVNLLLENGADPNIRDDLSGTALHFVGNTDIARKLIEYGADINSRTRGRGLTPIMNVALAYDLYNSKRDSKLRLGPILVPQPSQRKENVLKLLIDAGADISAQDNKKWTTLMWTIHSGSVRKLKVLLDLGVDITFKDVDDPDVFLKSFTDPKNDAASLYRKIEAFLKDPVNSIPSRKNSYSSYGYWLMGWDYIDQEALQYLIWSVAYDKYDAYLKLKNMYPELFKNVGILVKLFLLAAHTGSEKAFVDLKSLLKQKNISALQSYYLKAVELIMKYHPEKSRLAHQLMAEDIIMKKRQ